MAKRFTTSGQLELRIPLTVIGECWSMNTDSELRFSLLTSDSVKVNLLLEKSADHVKFLFTDFEDLPFLEVLSNLYRCSVDRILEYGTAFASAHETSIPLKAVNQCENLEEAEKQETDCVDFRAELQVDGAGRISDAHVKEEPRDGNPAWNQCESSSEFCVPKSEDDTVDYDINVSEDVGLFDSSDITDVTATADQATDGEICLSETLFSIGSHVQGNGSKTPEKPSKPKIPQIPKQGICPHCGIYYGNLSQHMVSYCSKNPDRKKVFHCCYCKFKARSRDELLDHKTTHVLLREFKCDICDSGFFTRQRLIRHQRYVHLIGNNPVKIYTCNVCDKRFHYRSHYDRHLTIHQDDKSVQCEMCGKFFKNQYNVHNHQLRMHPLKLVPPKTYPYCCEKCGHGFFHLGLHRCSEPQNRRAQATRGRTTNRHKGLSAKRTS